MKKEVEWLLKEKYHGKPTIQFREDTKRLKKGEPLDYVIGFTEFLGCKIDLSKKPLIPRPETEYWVQEAIKKMKSRTSQFLSPSIKVLDIFAGSGCIGISIVAGSESFLQSKNSLPRHIKHAKVTFAEKDKNLLQQIQINCRANKIPKKSYDIVDSDIFSNIKGRYDYIFANPPYIPEVKKNKIQKSVLRYEPVSALFGGKDGLLYIKKFLSGAKHFLNPGGEIYMEFDSTQKKKIEKLLRALAYKNFVFHKDQYGKWRYVVI
ncbi:MAG: hypothetical protein A3A98_02880 [Candidatus Staskawiczbacteria bacterium RIFCSPLOWO2_01_FULL_40_39]|uniref:peptide chain release factor N(5)-glutamine methyltransferase n=1 Tax=Candidatus Staskawiczbacteria bacterium RIFCSPHIGHO2_01_FULL_39_25 TaxID=1802202 RepID=A0A1G2HMC9_9BACT|nr:MAG: hypothetical protein A2730_03540 [Candidatus Staskawiczbacteria bacterium RIFCSPHIGHO2_01_FULL_39_25]OGZ73692.1 MAG: hypothetical protein A3A98_02880 [Candidatus Staskawiczbacteria bacterium RIFCSPLOWO2_01_FULL_40_39]